VGILSMLKPGGTGSHSGIVYFYTLLVTQIRNGDEPVDFP